MAIFISNVLPNEKRQGGSIKNISSPPIQNGLLDITKDLSKDLLRTYWRKSKQKYQFKPKCYPFLKVYVPKEVILKIEFKPKHYTL